MKDKAVIGLLLISAAAQAAPESSNEPPPSVELLEFLGEWQTKQGQPIDPFDLQEAQRQEQVRKPVEEQKHD